MPIGPRSSPAAATRAATFEGAGHGGSERLSSSAVCVAAVLVGPGAADSAGLVLQLTTAVATQKLRRRATTVEPAASWWSTEWEAPSVRWGIACVVARTSLLRVVAADAGEHVLAWRGQMVAVLDGVRLAEVGELVLGLRAEHLAAAVAGQGHRLRYSSLTSGSARLRDEDVVVRFSVG
jgi:hypothetical protein